jgi:tetratricopeptide (TPR) repeat protein
MAACAISTVWGQTPPAAPDVWSDKVQALKAEAKAWAESAKQASKTLGAEGDVWGDQAQTLRDQAKAMADDALHASKSWAPMALDVDAWRDNADAWRDNADAMREQAERMAQDSVWKSFEDLDLSQFGLTRMKFELAQDIAPKAPMAPMAPLPPKAFNFNFDSGSYEQGKAALDEYKYDKAVEKFEKVIDAKTPSSRDDGAYYWKAYALNKLGKRDEALAALAELAKQFPQSGWLNDAKALQAEVQQAKGQPVSPESQADEDLKLYAINALINSDAERAVPLLENLLANPKMSPRLKERALFVLAQSRSDKAHEIVGRYAKGGSNPDLQLTAVRYIGTYRSKESRQLLADVYASVNDVNVKRAVLRGFETSRDSEHLAAIAKSEQNVELRREAIRQLGNIREDQGLASLVSLYANESDRDTKREILRSLANQGAVKQLIECARKEKDPELKRVAVQRLGEMKSKEALDFIEELLK